MLRNDDMVEDRSNNSDLYTIGISAICILHNQGLAGYAPIRYGGLFRSRYGKVLKDLVKHHHPITVYNGLKGLK